MQEEIQWSLSQSEEYLGFLDEVEKSDWLQIENRNRIIEVLKNYKRVLENFSFKDLGGETMDFNGTKKTFKIGNIEYEKNVTPTFYIEYEYSENGRKSTFISNDGSKPECCEEKYDSHGNMILRTYEDGTQAVFKYDYDDKGNMVHMQGDDYEEWYKNNSEGKAIYAKDTEGDEVWFDYDQKGNLVHIKASDGTETFKEYNSEGHLIKETTKLNGKYYPETHLFEYDSEGHLVLEYIKKHHDELYEYKYNLEGKLVSKVFYDL